MKLTTPLGHTLTVSGLQYDDGHSPATCAGFGLLTVNGTLCFDDLSLDGAFDHDYPVSRAILSDIITTLDGAAARECADWHNRDAPALRAWLRSRQSGRIPVGSPH